MLFFSLCLCSHRSFLFEQQLFPRRGARRRNETLIFEKAGGPEKTRQRRETALWKGLLILFHPTTGYVRS